MKGLTIVVIILIVGFVLWSMSQGESVPNTPGTDDLPIPDNPEDGVNNIADWLETRPAWFWQFASMGIVLGLIFVASRRLPKLFWVLVGMAVMGFIAFAVMNR